MINISPLTIFETLILFLKFDWKLNKLWRGHLKWQLESQYLNLNKGQACHTHQLWNCLSPFIPAILHGFHLLEFISQTCVYNDHQDNNMIQELGMNEKYMHIADYQYSHISKHLMSTYWLTLS